MKHRECIELECPFAGEGFVAYIYLPAVVATLKNFHYWMLNVLE